MGGVGDQVHFVAETPFCFAVFASGTMFDAPFGIGIADWFPVGIGVALK